MHTGMVGSEVELTLCVQRDLTTFPLSSTTLTLTKSIAAVNMVGDPHVRAANGEWLDFYGQSGVYNLLDNDRMQAKAKFGYAVRDKQMIWHPRVMRPGTVMEEIGVTLLDERVSIRLAVHGGGIVSVREESGTTKFWTAAADHVIQVGDFVISWGACQQNCEVAMPWGTHERTRSLLIEGRGEFLQMFVTKSGGYRFVDVDSTPGPLSSGLLADANAAPASLAQRLMNGGEHIYQVGMSTLMESY